jgi:O-antigen ligase
MMISGTRGAISVPFAGIMLYIILRKNYKVMIIGAMVMVAVFAFFNYTYIGQGNGTIRRMRTAFNPEDASLQTRINNQQRIKGYLASRPFGGGIGATGALGQKYNPGSFLSQVPTDSWYVMVWMEGGIVGLILHLCLLFYILARASFMVLFRLKNDAVKVAVMAMASGMFGIMVASYGNPVLGQMPVGILLYSCMAFIFLAPRLDREVALQYETRLHA